MRYILLLCLLCSTKFGFLKAQQNDTLNIKHKFKPERVKFVVGINYTAFVPLMQQKDHFIGVGKINDSTHAFVDRNSKGNLNKNYSASNMQMSVQFNFWKNLYNGLHYEFFTVKNYKRHGKNLLSKKNTMFFAIATSVGYSFEFLKKKNLQLMPTFRIGGYAADSYFDGLGKKIYLGLDFKMRYFIKNKFGFSAGIDYEYFRFKAKGYNNNYQKPTYQKTSINNIFFNLGIAYNIQIKLDK